jgi:aminoglycoside phosphotransferase (APT) family kinase protein
MRPDMVPKPTAEVDIDTALVRALLHEQHVDLAALPLAEAGEGWDNRMFRLGDDLMVRLPRRLASATLIIHEQRWLPMVAARLPLPVPAPIRMGRPGCGFPWSWSVTPWLPGVSALASPPTDANAAAADLAAFLRALHQSAPYDAPRNPWRGVPLAERDVLFRKHLEKVRDRVNHAAVLASWQRLSATPPWTGAPSWIHGDLHPGNLLVRGGRLAGVLDFGDISSGDPATDLSVAWMLLPPPARALFCQLSCGPDGWLNEETWARARAWALALGVASLAHSSGDRRGEAAAQATIEAAILMELH